MLKPIAILCNTRACKNQSTQIFHSIAKILKEKNIAFIEFSDQWPEQLNQFSAAWIIGGDGTLNYFINYYHQVKLPIELFKGGTGNDFATFLYGKASLTEMVYIVLDAVPEAIDAGVSNGRYFLNTIGIGFDGKVLEHMKTIRWMGSFIGYYFAIIKNIFSFKESMYTICADGRNTFAGRFLLILVSNAPTTGGGFKVSHSYIIH